MAETMAAPGIIKAGVFKQLVLFAAAGKGNRKTNQRILKQYIGGTKQYTGDKVKQHIIVKQGIVKQGWQ